MINILHIVPDIAFGGVEKVVLNYYKYIDRSQFHFDYVSHGNVYDYHQEIVNDGSKILYFKTIGALGIKEYRKQINSSIDLSKYDIVHIHTGDITGIYAKAYKKCGANKIICHAHTAHPVTPKRALMKHIFQILANRWADSCLACGELAGKYCFGKKYRVLPNAIDVTNFDYISTEKCQEIKNELRLESDKIIIGHIGTYTPQKNHKFLLQVFADLLKVCNNYCLVLVGQETHCDECMDLIKRLEIQNNVIVCGPRSDVNVLMQVFDYFVLPSLFEGLPVSGIEAQCSGLKCFFSDTIDNTVDVGAGMAVFLPIHQGTKPWIKAITQSVAASKSAEERSRILLSMRKNGYEIQSSVSQLQRIYLELLSREIVSKH